MRVLGLSFAVALFLIARDASQGAAQLSSHYVSPRGSDANSGSGPGDSQAWQTIQHAVNVLRPGQTGIVLPGAYNERVSISSSGTAAAPITLRAADRTAVKVLGFDISGSYWEIDSFDISIRAARPRGYGIYIHDSASHDTVKDSYIHELCHEGIFVEPATSYITMSGNRIWRAEMAGLQLDGKYGRVIGNEIWDTWQFPSYAGGIYSGCDAPRGADADGMRFFGQHHLIERNYIHDIPAISATNPGPHVDCFQTWGSAAMIVDDVTFSANRCRWPDAAAGQNHAAMLSGEEGPVGTLIFQNNVLANMGQGINVGKGVEVLKVWNNTFDHILSEGVIFQFPRTSADEIINNIFYNVGSGGDSYLCLRGGNPTIESNDFYMPGGARPGTYCSNAPYVSFDPQFVSYGDSTGARSDYHLRNGSPIRDGGRNLKNVRVDCDGTARPSSASYSIGAFQR